MATNFDTLEGEQGEKPAMEQKIERLEALVMQLLSNQQGNLTMAQLGPSIGNTSTIDHASGKELVVINVPMADTHAFVDTNVPTNSRIPVECWCCFGKSSTCNTFELQSRRDSGSNSTKRGIW
ncbi:hypothetical protein SLA2020_002290 [Shorea laevis]